MSDSRFKEKEK